MDRKLETPTVKDISIKKVIAFTLDFTYFGAIKCLSNCLFFDESRNKKIDFIMSKEVSIAKSSWDIFVLESFFVSNHLRSAPVVDSENHLIGIVTRRDALLALEKCMEGRQEYKKEIKTPVELNMRQRIRMIANQV
jgi:predicted transcriptional regulator